MTNFNERTNTFLYKNIISHTLFSRGWCWLCVRGELEMGTDCYILTLSSSDHSSTSSAFWLGCSTVCHWGPKPSVRSWFSLHWHPISSCNWNWLLSVSWLYFCLMTTCFLWVYASAHHHHNSTTSTSQDRYTDIFDRMHLFCCSSTYLHRCIS